jgi:cytochrome c oxidase assembly protein subunit 11
VRAARRKTATVLGLLGVLGLMVTLVAFSVPLYRLFCQATGFSGTDERAGAAPAAEVKDRLITVRFDATTMPELGWEFRPLVTSVQVHPGEEKQVAFRARNLTPETVTGTATHNVTPVKAAIYFDKLQCFCFTKQRLAPGQSEDLWVSFFVDPDIASDPNTRDVDTITLSYTMFRAKDDGSAPVQSSALPATSRSVN